MPRITQIRFAGFGGQGVILAGTLLGEAGVVQGMNVAGSNSYGAQARGSGCTSEVILSVGPIDFPHVTRADVLVAMSQGSYDLYAPSVTADGGIILYDASQVTPRKDLATRQRGVPATDAAIKRLKNKQAANIVLLGALVELTRLASPESVESAMGRHVSERFRGLNIEAFRLGRELAGETDG
jgi:2-oxoglutarate ferredoxin oxidoreductase subunit gamma